MDDLETQLAAVEERWQAEQTKRAKTKARDPDTVQAKILAGFEKLTRQRQLDTGEVTIKTYDC
jgi:hypothetical protein